MTYDFNPFKKQITGVEDWIKKEFQQIRTGQASPNILDGVKVEVYGAIEGARTLRVMPWDKSQVKDIEKGIMAANLGLSVIVDDQGLRINFPELTADRRKDIAKMAKERLEEAKKQVRGHRDAVVKDLDAKEKAGGMGKDDAFRLKKDMQKIVDDANKKLDEAYGRKEKEILG
jgi:ribosome recycling factor